MEVGPDPIFQSSGGYFNIITGEIRQHAQAVLSQDEQHEQRQRSDETQPAADGCLQSRILEQRPDGQAQETQHGQPKEQAKKQEAGATHRPPPGRRAKGVGEWGGVGHLGAIIP